MGIQIRLLRISSLVKTARVIKQVKANVAVKNETVKYSINFLDPFDVSWTLYLYAAVQNGLGNTSGYYRVGSGWTNCGVVGLLVYL